MNYKVSELAEKTGVTKRTIHFYISKGLLLPPKGSGVNSLYSDEHVERIQLIKKLQAEYLPLNKIRDIINGKEDYKKLEEEKLEENIKTEESASSNDSVIYVRKDVAGIFEMHYTKENGEKYGYIIEKVKKYVEKMLSEK